MVGPSAAGDPVRVSCIIPGAYESVFHEGLFQYLRMMLGTLQPSMASFKLVVSVKSISAFDAWLDLLPADARKSVSVVPAPSGVADEIWPAEVHEKSREWVEVFEVDVDCWFCIRPDLPIIQVFTKPVVSLFADFLHVEYPLLYPEGEVELAYRGVMVNNKLISRYVCFSEHVKRHQIMKAFDIKEDRIDVMPHPYVDYRAATNVSFDDRRQAAVVLRAFLADFAACVRDHRQASLLGPWLREFPFEDVNFVFMSTRARPHKNANVIVEAAEILIREYEDIKVVVTTPIIWNDRAPGFSSAIIDRGLQWDIISINQCPPAVHAALYMCAAVTVHPSPFEGGFPFTVSESISMGTPVLLADGPVVSEALSIEEKKEFCFDPTSPQALAGRIKDALTRREELLGRQREIVRGFPRTLAGNMAQLVTVLQTAAQEGSTRVEAAVPGRHAFGESPATELAGTGWYPPEPWGRWAQHNKAVIRFRRIPGSGIRGIELSMAAPPYPPGHPIEGWISINDGAFTIPCRARVLEGNSRLVILEGLRDGVNEISIFTRILYRPKDVGESEDERELGLGVREIVFLV